MEQRPWDDVLKGIEEENCLIAVNTQSIQHCQERLNCIIYADESHYNAYCTSSNEFLYKGNNAELELNLNAEIKQLRKIQIGHRAIMIAAGLATDGEIDLIDYTTMTRM